MPTLVAHKVAATKTCASAGALRKESAEAPKPRAKVATTPSVETSSDDQPTDNISRTFDSSPTSNRRMMTPISASAPTTASARKRSTHATPKSERLPRSMPPANSPSTAGCLSRANNSPPSFATTSIKATERSTAGSSPLAVPPSGVAAPAHARAPSDTTASAANAGDHTTFAACARRSISQSFSRRSISQLFFRRSAVFSSVKHSSAGGGPTGACSSSRPARLRRRARARLQTRGLARRQVSAERPEGDESEQHEVREEERRERRRAVDDVLERARRRPFNISRDV